MTDAQRQAMQMALRALYRTQSEPGSLEFEINEEAIAGLREALAEPQEQFQQVGWAISYDGGQTPYCLWYEGDGDLLDLEVRRLGGTASKMPLFAKVTK